MKGINQEVLEKVDMVIHLPVMAEVVAEATTEAQEVEMVDQ